MAMNCPKCGADVSPEWKLCPHCGRRLTAPGLSWWFKTPTLVISFLCVGPFMLPLVWLHPRYSAMKKIIVTLIIGAVSFALIMMTVKSLQSVLNYYKMMQP